eukprot:1449170-Rhodomonas_salina.5
MCFLETHPLHPALPPPALRRCWSRPDLSSLPLLTAALYFLLHSLLPSRLASSGSSASWTRCRSQQLHLPGRRETVQRFPQRVLGVVSETDNTFFFAANLDLRYQVAGSKQLSSGLERRESNKVRLQHLR